LHLDAAQGESEQHTEVYLTYIEGVAELLTQRCAKIHWRSRLGWQSGGAKSVERGKL